MASAKGNRDFVISSMTEALEAIGDLTDGLEPTAIPFLSAVEGSSSSKLYQRFDEFEVSDSTLYNRLTVHVTCPIFTHVTVYIYITAESPRF